MVALRQVLILAAVTVVVGVMSGCSTLSRNPSTTSAPRLSQERLQSMLIGAAIHGDVAKIKDLLWQGADPNEPSSMGDPPLYLAASGGYREAVEALISGGAKVNARRKDGRTALHIASSFGRTGAVSALLSHGADVNIVDQHGKTALHEAGRHKATVEALMAYKPRIDLRDDSGKTAAEGTWDKEIKQLILSGGRVEPKIASTAPPVVSEPATVAALIPDRFKGRPRPQAIALVIGIEGYESAPAAEFGENDARRFSEYAVNALGVPRDRIKVLLGSGARRLDIEKALHNWVSPLVAKGRSEVFIFFSGHGLASEDGSDLFLLPYDGDHTLLSRSGIRRKDVIDTVMGAGAASATLFLDTCYSGGTRGKDTLIASARPVLLAAKETGAPTGVTILAAAANNQLSSSYPAAKHGLFSYWLMKGLEGEAAAGGRTITASKLKAYLAEKVPSEAAKLGRVQTPQLIGDGDRVVASW